MVSAPPSPPLGLCPQQAAQKMFPSSLVSARALPSSTPPAREQEGRAGREGRFIQRSELHAPALGSHPITLTRQFTGQLHSKD